jgi:hypothetical protein
MCGITKRYWESSAGFMKFVYGMGGNANPSVELALTDSCKRLNNYRKAGPSAALRMTDICKRLKD